MFLRQKNIASPAHSRRAARKRRKSAGGRRRRAWSRPQGMSCIVIMFRRGGRRLHAASPVQIASAAERLLRPDLRHDAAPAGRDSQWRARMPALTLISLASVSCKSENFPVLQEAFLRRAGFQGFCKKDFCLQAFYFLQISDIPYFARNASGRSRAGAGAARRRPDMTVGRQRPCRLLLFLIKVQS